MGWETPSPIIPHTRTLGLLVAGLPDLLGGGGGAAKVHHTPLSGLFTWGTSVLSLSRKGAREPSDASVADPQTRSSFKLPQFCEVPSKALVQTVVSCSDTPYLSRLSPAIPLPADQQGSHNEPPPPPTSSQKRGYTQGRVQNNTCSLWRCQSGPAMARLKAKKSLLALKAGSGLKRRVQKLLRHFSASRDQKVENPNNGFVDAVATLFHQWTRPDHPGPIFFFYMDPLPFRSHFQIPSINPTSWGWH